MTESAKATYSPRKALPLIWAIAFAISVAFSFAATCAYAEDAQDPLFGDKPLAQDELAVQDDDGDEPMAQDELVVQGEAGDEAVAQEESAADAVIAAIDALSDDPRTYTVDDKARVEAIQADYEALSDADRATVDATAYTGGSSAQSLDRVLEAALWAVWSYDTDPSTTLLNGTYTTKTERAVSSVSSKGKSTSGRTRNWWVESVQAIDGQAVANIYVTSGAATASKLTSYPSVWIAGLTVYPNPDNTYTIPVDLNGTTYFGGVSSSMPVPIMYALDTAIDESLPVYTVTFMDGSGNVLSTEEVEHGGQATPPEPPEPPEGFVFAGWDKPFDNITEATVVTALWSEPEAASYKVTFLDGWRGKTLKSEIVKEGEAATAPDDPTRPFHTFDGWDPETFDNVTAALEVTALWKQTPLDIAQEAIAALPANPLSIEGDVANGRVAAALAAYDALDGDSKAQLSDGELLSLAKCVIVVLPRDAFAITGDHAQAVAAAQAVYDALPKDLQAQLDDGSNLESRVSDSRTYGRHLESAAWALDALDAVDNATSLAAGTYTKGISSLSSLGKSTSDRKRGFTVRNVVVESGRAYAVVEYEASTAEWLSIGGTRYKSDETDPRKPSYFKIPVKLNEPFHFSMLTKSANENTDAIAYEMTITANESTLEPDKETQDPSKAEDTKKPEDSSSADGSGKTNDPQTMDLSAFGRWFQAAWQALLNRLSNGNATQQQPSNPQQGNGANTSSPASSSSNGNQQNGNTPGDAGQEDDNAASSGAASKVSSSGTSNSGSTGGSTSGSSTSGSGTNGSSGNLSSLLRNATTRASSNTTSNANASKSSTSASKSSGSNSSESKSSESKSSGSAKKGDGEPSVQEVRPAGAAAVQPAEEPVDLSPALAGGSLLGLSLGSLAFVLLFVRREGDSA